MSKFQYIVLFLGMGFFTFSCEDVIDVDADFTEAQLVVDAWLNNMDTTQTVFLSLSQDYFDATLPPAITDAQVTLTNTTSGTIIPFEHKSNGAYEWTPSASETIGLLGDEFVLTVEYNNFTYEAASAMNPAPPVDSIAYEFREEEFGFPEGIYAQFYARDIVGQGNTYWIKTYKNGTFLNKPSELNLSADGTFDLGSAADGIVFIPPIRELVNRISDPDTEDNEDVPPYAEGDHIRVEIHALTNEAFRFMQVAQEQMTNGDNGIFALPVANSPSNVFGVQSDAPQALGFFNVGQVTAGEVVIQ